MGGGGGKTGGVEEMSWGERTAMAKSYWENYNKWTSDETSRYEKDLSRMRAQAGAGGQGVESELYKQYEKTRTAEYDTEMNKIKSGEHARFLNEFADMSYRRELAEYDKTLEKKYAGRDPEAYPMGFNAMKERNNFEKTLNEIENSGGMYNDEGAASPHLVYGENGRIDMQASRAKLGEMTSMLDKRPKKKRWRRCSGTCSASRPRGRARSRKRSTGHRPRLAARSKVVARIGHGRELRLRWQAMSSAVRSKTRT